MQFIDANGQKLWMEQTGTGTPALVFSHGLLMDRTMFAPQVKALSDRYQCISWDQRGHGLTQEDGAPFSYWDSARDCLAVMDAAGIERAVLVGMSQGGFLSLRAALLAPTRIAGLILIATQAGTDSPETHDGFRRLQAEWAANGPKNAGPDVARMLLGQSEEEAIWEAKWAEQPKNRLGPCVETLIARDDITDQLSAISCPTLVIHGDADQAIPQDRGRALADNLPGNRGFVSVSGAAHAPNLTHPDVVNPAIEQFLAEISNTGDGA